ncbi:MAG: response regulator [Pseudomonadota bacterium]
MKGNATDPAAAIDSERPAMHGNQRPQGAAWVLVVDDNETERSEMAEAISEMGHFTWLANSLSEAERLVHQDSDIRAVVLDIGLPDGNGLNLLRSLQSGASHLEDRQIIVVTGLSESERPADKMFGEIRHVFRKPVDLLQLEETLGRILRDSGDRSTVPTSPHKK